MADIHLQVTPGTDAWCLSAMLATLGVILFLGLFAAGGASTLAMPLQRQFDGQRVLRPYSVPQFRDPMLGTSWANRTFKRAVFVLFSKQEMLDIVASLRYAEPQIWFCSVNVHPDYSRHLNSRIRRKEKNKRTGKVEWRWHELHQSNHLYDTEVHVTLRALQLGLLVLPNQTEQANVI